jgi:hypothetical protein
MKLAEFYVSGKAFPPDFAVALTIMLILQNTFYDPENNPFIERIKARMTRKQIRDVEQAIGRIVANDPIDVRSYSSLLPNPDEYLKSHPFEDAEDSPVALDSNEQEPSPEATDSADQDTPSEVNADDIDESFEIEFMEAKSIKKGFDPKKVRITLIAGKPMVKTDYTHIVFSYGSLHDKKSKKLFGNKYKINHRERKLLIALAFHGKNEGAIASVIRAAKTDSISRLNTMLVSVFKGCFANTQSSLINNEKARLNIKAITFQDVWNIERCSDYQECINIKP